MKPSQKPYHFFAHTADVGLGVRGKTMAALFQNAASGVTSFLTHPENLKAKKKAVIELKAESWESLLVDWLGEVLYHFTVRGTGSSRFKVKTMEPHSIRAECWGEKLNPKRHPVFHEIKAVTYHDLKIRKRQGHFLTRIILDI